MKAKVIAIENYDLLKHCLNYQMANVESQKWLLWLKVHLILEYLQVNIAAIMQRKLLVSRRSLMKLLLVYFLGSLKKCPNWDFCTPPF